MSEWPVKKVILLTITLGLLALLMSPNGPLGSFWRPSPELPSPSKLQMVLFLGVSIAEAFAFGFGVSFLIWGRKAMQKLNGASATLRNAAYLGISWLLINWWPHDSLHMHVGHRLNQLIAIEYAFHVTLIISGVIVVRFLLQRANEKKEI